MKRVYPIEDRCIGCRLCEVVCIVAHSRSKDALTAYWIEDLCFNDERAKFFVDPAEVRDAGMPPTTARCKVWPSQPFAISTSCRHCSEPECVLACKNGALYQDAEGRVLLDETKCVGCWMCLMACPCGAVSRNVFVSSVPDVPRNGINHHCDLCVGREIPACVQICPVRSPVFEDREAEVPEPAVVARDTEEELMTAD